MATDFFYLQLAPVPVMLQHDSSDRADYHLDCIIALSSHLKCDRAESWRSRVSGGTSHLARRSPNQTPTSILNLVTVHCHCHCSAVPSCVSHSPALRPKLLGGFEFAGRVLPHHHRHHDRGAVLLQPQGRGSHLPSLQG